MIDQLTPFWGWFIAIATIVSILACAVLLKLQTIKRPPKGEQVALHGNVWDEDLTEYNHPLPNWWKWLFYLTIIFSVIYLLLYPGLGAIPGTFGWSSSGQYQDEVKAADAQTGPLFAKYTAIDIPTLSKDAQAAAMGQRLFLNYCAQCHGSDAGGGNGFPNLRDKDWLYGGDPSTIVTSLNDGRAGLMPALGEALGEAGVTELTHYVRSLSKQKHDPALAALGQQKFALCAACHGADGRGNRLLGAPNLSDDVWLYGSSEATIADIIRRGRSGNMPAQLQRLGAPKIHLIAAYVYGLGGGEPPVSR